jgi:SIR2-like domain
MSVVAWPSTLVDRIASDHWVLFIGSGVSASCENESGARPPDWNGLLTKLSALITDETRRKMAVGMIRRREYLAAADHIQYSVAQQEDRAAYHQAIKAAVERPPADRFRPSSLYFSLLNLEPKIVFTTNYDKLFESASQNGFAVHTFESTTVGDALRIGEPVFVKLHGSTDSISDAVLTRTDYARASTKGRATFDALAALSLTSTILFVGYSLDDPDIQLVLQAVGRSGMRPEAHFMLTSRPRSPSRVPVFRESFGVSVLTYPAGSHDKAEVVLTELSELVVGVRQRGAQMAT